MNDFICNFEFSKSAHTFKKVTYSVTLEVFDIAKPLFSGRCVHWFESSMDHIKQNPDARASGFLFPENPKSNT
ncbi:hypothetical protein [Gelidibacter mesophilus]|uniref:hypothetical protein n=1 Tax=Gelidibacter mesophilus TaxID=169050 RepID=UPI00040D3E8B|nr:hypothetical protein [Gelidibacter mesophilus]